MPNPIFQVMHGNQKNGMMQQFQSFMQSHPGDTINPAIKPKIIKTTAIIPLIPFMVITLKFLIEIIK